MFGAFAFIIKNAEISSCRLFYEEVVRVLLFGVNQDIKKSEFIIGSEVKFNTEFLWKVILG